MAQSGARLREVGTTNRTRLEDYRRALGDGVAMILTVHRSNFEQRGFVASPEPAALATLAVKAGVPYLYDVGSGLLADLSPWGLRSEPGVAEGLAAGAEPGAASAATSCSAAAGRLPGRAAAPCSRAAGENPFARAMRADKFTLAALEATLALYEDPETAVQGDPGAAHADDSSTGDARRARRAHRGGLSGAARAELRPG